MNRARTAQLETDSCFIDFQPHRLPLSGEAAEALQFFATETPLDELAETRDVAADDIVAVEFN